MNRSLVARFILQLQDRASAGIGALQRRLQGLAQASRRVAVIGGIGAALTFAGPLREAAAFDDTLRQTAMTAGLSGAAVEASIAQQGAAFEGLARRTGQSSASIAKAAGEMAAAGLDPELVQRFSPIIARFATATGASMEDLGRVVIRLNQNLRITSVEEMTGALASMLQASRDGSVEIADMARIFPTLTASVNALGVRGRPAVDMLAAMLQVAARGAATASEAGNNLQNFLSKLAMPETVRNFREMGVTIPTVLADAARRGINPIEALIQKVRELTGGDMFRVGELFGDMQVLNYLRPMLDGIPEYLSILRGAAAANESIINASFEDRWRGLTIQMALAQEGVTQLSRRFSVNLLPVVRTLASGLLWLSEQYDAFSQKHPRLTRDITLLAAGVAGLITIAGVLGFVLGPIAAGFAFLASPIGAAIGLVAAFALAAWQIYENWDDIAGWFSRQWTQLRTGMEPQVNEIVSLATGLGRSIRDGIGWLWENSGLPTAIAGISEGLQQAWEIGSRAWLESPIGRLASHIADGIREVLALIERLRAAWNDLVPSFTSGDGAAANAAGPAVGSVQSRQRAAAAARAALYPPGELAGAVAGNDNPATSRTTVGGEITVRAAPGTEIVSTETANSNVPITASGNRGATRGRP